MRADIYAYVGGNPISWVDPFGLESEENWFPPNGVGTYWVSAQNHNSPPGTYTISTHGILGTRYLVGPNGKPMNGQQVWNQIKDKFEKGGYTKIRLAVCEAGKDDASGRSLADDVNAWSGKPTEATPNQVGYPINGQLFIGSPLPGYIPPKTTPIPGAQWELLP